MMATVIPQPFGDLRDLAAKLRATATLELPATSVPIRSAGFQALSFTFTRALRSPFRLRDVPQGSTCTERL